MHENWINNLAKYLDSCNASVNVNNQTDIPFITRSNHKERYILFEPNNAHDDDATLYEWM